MLFYAQRVNQASYYQIITASAERAVPGEVFNAFLSTMLQLFFLSSGCPNAVRSALSLLLSSSPLEIARELRFCEPIPPYLSILADSDAFSFRNEILMLVMVQFANGVILFFFLPIFFFQPLSQITWQIIRLLRTLVWLVHVTPLCQAPHGLLCVYFLALMASSLNLPRLEAASNLVCALTTEASASTSALRYLCCDFKIENPAFGRFRQVRTPVFLVEIGLAVAADSMARSACFQWDMRVCFQS